MTDRILRRREVVFLTGLSRSSIYRLMADGKFPRPLRITDKRAVGWKASEIQNYIETCATSHGWRLSMINLLRQTWLIAKPHFLNAMD